MASSTHAKIGNACTHMRMTVPKRWEAPKGSREDWELWVCIGCRKEAACFVPLCPSNFSSALNPELVSDSLDVVQKGAVLGGHDRGVGGGGGGHLGQVAKTRRQLSRCTGWCSEKESLSELGFRECYIAMTMLSCELCL